MSRWNSELFHKIVLLYISCMFMLKGPCTRFEVNICHVTYLGLKNWSLQKSIFSTIFFSSLTMIFVFIRVSNMTYVPLQISYKVPLILPIFKYTFYRCKIFETTKAPITNKAVGLHNGIWHVTSSQLKILHSRLVKLVFEN